MTNKVPFPEVNAGGVITLKVVQGEVPSAREDAQLSQITRLCSLMEDCWRFDPKKRPDIARCTNEVKRMVSRMVIRSRQSLMHVVPAIDTPIGREALRLQRFFARDFVSNGSAS